jgi:hypothetical protein
MLQAYPGDDPRFADIEWIRVNPNDAAIAEPTELEVRILRARNAWLKRK